MTDSPIGRLELVAFDCPDPLALARFYQQIVGGEVADGGDPDGDWIELRTPSGTLAFQRVDDHRPPTWPSGDVPQQAHTDVLVADLDAGEAGVLALGAIKVEVQPRPDRWRVFLDPAGHPFCLVVDDAGTGQG